MGTSCSNKEKLLCCAEADCSDKNKTIIISISLLKIKRISRIIDKIEKNCHP